MTDKAAGDLLADDDARAGMLRRWYRRHVAGPPDPGGASPDRPDRPDRLDRVHADSRWSGRHAFLTAMSAGIAIAGLLLSSPAVIIGAMLMSPLSGPAVGLGFAFATVDWASALKAMLALVAGAVLAVLLAALLVLASPLQDMTAEILARTRPNLFDLLVAVFAGLAGGYAAARGRGEAIVGVAIATALLPPLAVAGYGIATANLPVLSGSLALFLTSLLAISFSAALAARCCGFTAAHLPGQGRAQLTALLLLALALATPLFLSIRQIAWEALSTRSMRTALNQEFGDSGRITSLDPNFSGAEVVVRATVLTDRYHDKAKADLERRLAATIRRPVKVELSQLLVNESDARTELDRARSQEARNREDRVARADMAARLSLVSGVPVADVLVDPVARIATAQAAAGQSLQQAMQAEARLAADSPGWRVKLLPPAGLFPPLDLEAESSATDTEDADRPEIAAIVWALQRLGTDSIRVTARQLAGEPRARAVARGARVAAALREKGLTVEEEAPLPADRALERDLGANAMRAVELEPMAHSGAAADQQADEAVSPPPARREA